MYDSENAVKDVVALYKEKFNAKVLEINSEKGATLGDPVFMPDILADEANYIIHALDDRVRNFSGPFIFVQIDNTEVDEEQYENFENNTKVAINVMIPEDGAEISNDIIYKLMRYQRVLNEVILENSDVFRGYCRPLVSKNMPQTLDYFDSRFLTVSVEITASLTAR